MSSRRNALAIVAGILALATFAGLLTDWIQQRDERREAAERFDVMCAMLTQEVQARVHQYEYGLRGLRGAVVAAGAERVTRWQVRDYSATRDVALEFPGARGFGVVERVMPGAEDAFVSRIRHAGWPEFSIHRLAAHGGESEVIAFVEPMDANLSAVGLDIASEPRRHLAAMAAVRDGTARLTSPITLVQAAAAPQRGLLLLLPIFRAGMPIATPEQRSAAAIGWTYAPLVSDQVLSHLNLFDGQLRLRVSDQEDALTSAFFSTDPSAVAAGTLQRRNSIQLYGRTWVLEIAATPRFDANQDIVARWRIGGIAGVLAALLVVAGVALTRARRRQRRDHHEMARRSAIVESSEDAIIAETLEGVIVEWNLGAERLFGFSASEAVGRTAAALILPAQRGDEDAQMRAVIARGERLAAFDTTRTRRDGTLIDVSITAAPILDAQGRCAGFAKTLRDITETQAARRKLSLLNESLETLVAERTHRLDVALRDLRTILDSVPSMIGYWDATLSNRVANRSYAAWFGCTPEQLQGRKLADVLDPSVFASLRPNIEAALAGVPQSFPRSVAQEGGVLRHFLVHYMPDVVDSGVKGFYVLVHDVTELTDNQRALSDALRENAAILQTLHRYALVSVADRAGRIIEVNDSFCRVSGYTEEELCGQNHRIVNSGRHEPEFWKQMWRTLGRGQVWRGEVCNKAKDGSFYWVDSVIAPFLDASGKVDKYISIRTDITPIKRLQEEAESARRMALDASAAKSRFLANMSHEIRTPMNAVIGLSYLLGKMQLTSEQARFVDKINVAGRALLALINDILDLSKIEASELRLEEAAFSLRELISEASAIVSIPVGQKGIRFDVQVDSDVPDGLVGDPTRLRQVLINLLGNAVKFTERGAVRLEVQLDADAAQVRDRPRMVFRIGDSGIGIASDQLANLFQPFVQADTSTTRRFGGTGLGLSIVKQLVDLMGGRLDVESELDRGTTFAVQLSFGAADRQAMPDQRLPRPAIDPGVALLGLTILVVDDSDINLEVARRILESEGAEIVLARDGSEAVDTLQSVRPLPDLVLMDVQMPRLDGHDATQAIRRELGLTALPIIALTAGMTDGERDRATAAGMDGVLGKPFDPDVLISTVLRHLNKGPASAQRIEARVPRSWPALDGIDSEDVRRRLGGNLAVLRTLLSRFVRDAKGLERTLKEPWSLEPPGVAPAMHSLKGLAGTIGAKELAELAACIEQGVRDGGQTPDPAAMRKLTQSLEKVCSSCAAFLAIPDATDDSSRDQGGALSPGDIADLICRLERFEFGALASVRRSAPAIRARLGEAKCRELLATCEDLEFDRAADILRTWSVA